MLECGVSRSGGIGGKIKRVRQLNQRTQLLLHLTPPLHRCHTAFSSLLCEAVSISVCSCQILPCLPISSLLASCLLRLFHGIWQLQQQLAYLQLWLSTRKLLATCHLPPTPPRPPLSTMAKTVSSKTKLEREREKAEKAAQKQQLAAEREKARQQKETEKAQAAAIKATKAAERARIEAEREKLRREKEEVRMERERLAVEREKDRMAREKEKSERDKEKSGKDKAKKEKAQEQERLADRSRNLLSAFLGVAPKPAANDTQPAGAATTPTAPQTSIDVAVADGGSGSAATPSSSATSSSSSCSSSCSSSSSSTSSPATASPPSPPQLLFHPFQLKPNSSLAPVHRLPPANTDEIDCMTQQHSPSSTCPHYPALASPSSALSSHSSIHRAYLLDSAGVVHGRKRRRCLFYCRPSRRNKLIQHQRTFRPPFYGYLPSLPARPLSAAQPFALQSSGINYEVDSDEEWGEEPEGEELGEDEEEDEEGDGGKEASRGQLRRDGYEEDGDFTVPEDEDEALLMGGLMAEARVMEKGGKKRVVIRPIVVGPWHVGDTVTAEVAELRRRTQWKWCRSLAREVVKRTKEGDEEKVERSETGKAHKRKAEAAVAETNSVSSDREHTGVEEHGAGTSAVQHSQSGQRIEQQQQLQVGGCFIPLVKKKVKRTIVPLLTSAPPVPPTTADPASDSTATTMSHLPSSVTESKGLDSAVCLVDAMCAESEGVVAVSEVAMVDVDGGRCASGSELEVSELELTTELSCSETGTCSDMLTSELSIAD